MFDALVSYSMSKNYSCNFISNKGRERTSKIVRFNTSTHINKQSLNLTEQKVAEVSKLSNTTLLRRQKIFLKLSVIYAFQNLPGPKQYASLDHAIKEIQKIQDAYILISLRFSSIIH